MFILPDLPYDYSALEPFIDTETMHIHHDKHHATYVKNLNEALSGHDALLNMEINDLLQNLDEVPEEIRTKVKNNAGGVANHNMFWRIMCKAEESGKPSDNLENALNEAFGSFSKFQEKFSSVALSHFGSGWAWLTLESGILNIESSANQDTPVSEGKTSILLLDVWEHAYYLKYKNLRADYIKSWWNVVNWKEVSEYYDGLR